MRVGKVGKMPERVLFGKMGRKCLDREKRYEKEERRLSLGKKRAG